MALATDAAQAAPAISIDPLRPERAARGSAVASLCNATRTWCVNRREGADRLEVIRGGLTAVIVAMLPLETDENVASAPWPFVATARLADGREVALAGVERTERQMYSGGSAAVTRLELYELSDGAAPLLVLDAPLSSSIQVRACFSRADEKRRLGACKDEYSYRATLTPDASAAVPRLIYRSVAETYPGRRSRERDALQEPPLRKADLRTVADPKCSVTRTLTRDPASGAFEWNAPLPACDDFLNP